MKKDIINHVLISVREVVQREDDNPRAVYAAILSKAHVQAYLADFYSKDFYRSLIRFPKSFLRPSCPPEYNVRYGYFLDENSKMVDGARHTEMYPLTREELDKAKTVYCTIPLLVKAVAGFQAGMASYMKDVLKALAKQKISAYDETINPNDDRTIKIPIQSFQKFLKTGGSYEAQELDGEIDQLEEGKELPKAYDQLRSALNYATIMYGEVAGDSFMQDLVPIIASRLDNGDDFDGEDIRQGLVFAFKRSAFKTYQDTKNGPEIHHCPFSKVVAHLTDTVLEDHNGQLRVTDRIEPGSLIMLIADKIQKFETARPDQVWPRFESAHHRSLLLG